MRGGARPGAGRKKGGKNRATILREQFASEGLERAMASGTTPLEIILTVMRGGPEAEAITDRQFAAAKEAAPYLHPRLASTEARVVADVTMAECVDRPPRESREEWIARRTRELGFDGAILGPAAGTAD